MKFHLVPRDILLRKTIPLFFALFSLIGCALITIMVLLYQSEITSNQIERNGKLTQSIAIQLHIVGDVMGSIIDDLLFLSQQNELIAFLDTGDEGWIPLIEREYVNTLKIKAVYDQLRFLDNSGKERVRVNYNNGQIRAVDTGNLQNKAGRYYFKKTIELDQGAIYASPLDLNVENGAIEQPFKPMIRVASPVFDKNNQKWGVIVINYLAENLLSEIQKHSDNTLSEVMLIDSEAFWLLSPRPDQAWGFMINDRRNHRFSLRYSEAWPFISHHKKGQVNTPNGLFAFSYIYPLLEGRFPPVGKKSPDEASPNLPDQYSSYHWILIHRISPDRLKSFKNALVNKYLFFSISLLIIIAPGSWVMALETTRRKAQDTQLANLAMVDALTGLPNRRAFVESLQMDVARAIRHKHKLGLLYIDIDGFKSINDTKGHDAGDSLLVAIGEKLKQHLRKSDMVARIGGDEFVCILAEIDSIDGALQAGKNLTAALSQPIDIDAGEVRIGASIGAAVFPDHATDVNALVKAADEAMYQAKVSGKNNCIVAQV